MTERRRWWLIAYNDGSGFAYSSREAAPADGMLIEVLPVAEHDAEVAELRARIAELDNEANRLNDILGEAREFVEKQAERIADLERHTIRWLPEGEVPTEPGWYWSKWKDHTPSLQWLTLVYGTAGDERAAKKYRWSTRIPEPIIEENIPYVDSNSPEYQREVAEMQEAAESQPDGATLKASLADIEAGRTKPVQEVIDKLKDATGWTRERPTEPGEWWTRVPGFAEEQGPYKTAISWNRVLYFRRSDGKVIPVADARDDREWRRCEPAKSEQEQPAPSLSQRPLSFSERNRLRCESPNGFNHKLDSWSLSDWLTATAGELGEAANVIKKLNRCRDGIPGNDKTEAELREQLAEEIADTACYLDLFAQAAGLDLKTIRDAKFAKVSKKIGYEEQRIFERSKPALQPELEMQHCHICTGGKNPPQLVTYYAVACSICNPKNPGVSITVWKEELPKLKALLKSMKQQPERPAWMEPLVNDIRRICSCHQRPSLDLEQPFFASGTLATLGTLRRFVAWWDAGCQAENQGDPDAYLLSKELEEARQQLACVNRQRDGLLATIHNHRDQQRKYQEIEAERDAAKIELAQVKSERDRLQEERDDLKGRLDFLGKHVDDCCEKLFGEKPYGADGVDRTLAVLGLAESLQAENTRLAAACAAMREALTKRIGRGNGNDWLSIVEVISHRAEKPQHYDWEAVVWPRLKNALADSAGQDLLDRLAAAEKACAAMRKVGARMFGYVAADLSLDVSRKDEAWHKHMSACLDDWNEAAKES